MREWLNAVAWMDLDLSTELHASLVRSPVQVFRFCVTLPHKTLNSPGRSQQKNLMLLSLGIAIALYVLSSGGDVGSVCVYDHFISLSAQDSFLLRTQISGLPWWRSG